MLLLLPVKAIAELNRSVMVFFSTGKDSVVTLDLISKFVKDFKIVYLYYYKNLEIREKVLRFYEKRYKKKIIRLPHPERIWFFKRMRKDVGKTNVVINDVEPYLKQKYNVSFFAWGHRIAESLTRRAMLSRFKNGIDLKTGRVYPVIHFKKKHILEYIKQNRLLLPIDYEYGFSDVNIFRGDVLIWLYNNFRNDYNRIKQEFAFIEEDLQKALWEKPRY